MDDNSTWSLIESDPGVFTELIKGFGCKGLQVEEIHTIEYLSDSELLEEKYDPVHGLIFLYRWRPADNLNTQGELVKDPQNMGLFFAKQTINNACATQAIISVLLNSNHSDIILGDILTKFKDYVALFSATDKGLSLANYNEIKDVHNSFARHQMFDIESVQAKEGDDVFHFIAYIPFMGRVYELDGLKDGPVDLGVSLEENKNWLSAVKQILQLRIDSYPSTEIHFNLLAVTSDRSMIYQRRIGAIEDKMNIAAQKMECVLSEGMSDESSAVSAEYAELPAEPEELQQIIEECEDKIKKLNVLINEEQDKMNRYHIENIRRKHNYLPVILEVLKILATKGKLVSLAEKAKSRSSERSNQQQTKKTNIK